MKKFAVFGNPVSHSLSPSIHQMFAEATGEYIEYKKIEAPVSSFESAIETFFSQKDAVGCNVTVPFKERAFQLVQQNTNEEAFAAKAVNTLFRQPDGELSGFNTDGIGLVADLKNHATGLANKRVLLLGAGGAARGVIKPLLEAGISQLAIANRTFAKARAIIQDLPHPNLSALEGSELKDFHPDIIVNSTSASLSGELPAVEGVSFSSCELAYDMVYSKAPTSFMRFAKESGAKSAHDGFGMLVEQAAAAFSIWTGKLPQTTHIIQKLRPR